MSQQEVVIETPSEWVTCPACQQPVKAKGKYGHFKTAHPELDYQEYRDKFKPTPVPEGKEGIREAPLYKGELDTTTILRDILKKHPDIPPKVVEEVCSWAEYGPIHPTQLVYLLSSMRGISTTTANIVAQKYSLALQRAASEGKMQLPSALYAPMPQAQPSPWGYPMPLLQTQPQPPPITAYAPPPEARSQALPPSQQSLWSQPQYWQQPWPQNWPAQPPISEEKVRGIFREEMERVERGKAKEPEPTIEIEDPVRDPDGKIIVGPDDKPIVKRMRVPVSQAAAFTPREDVEEKVLTKAKFYKDLFQEGGKTGITQEDIRRITKEVIEESETKLTAEDVMKIVEEKLRPAEHPELPGLRRELEETKKKLDEMKEHLEKSEKERFEDRIKSLESEIRRVESLRSAEGYKTDEFRILGEGLSKVAAIAEKKEPIKVIIEKGPELLGMTGAVGTPERPAPAHARAGILAVLRDRGLTTRA